jgi:O-antigen/teichoic acid export membrane protein
MIQKRQSLKINAISNWISLLIQVAIGFFLTPFVINHLGQSGYGIWVLVGSFIGYYGLLNLGVGSAITRYVARFSSQKDTKSLNKTANTALAMFCITGIIAFLLSFLIAAPLSRFFHITPEHLVEFKQIIIVLGIATGLSFPSGVFSAMITAREHYVAVNIVNILATLLRVGLTVIILQYGHGLAGIAYPTLAATIISFIAFYIIVKKVVPEFILQTNSIRLTTLKMLLVYGSYTTVISIADILRLKIDSIVIGKMIGMEEVGIYGVAALLIQHMLSIVASGMGVLTPRFTSLDTAENKEELKKTFCQALSISSFISCGVALLLLLLGQPFIFLWVGKDFADAVPVLTILTISYTFALSQNPGISLMFALNKHRYYATITMLEAIANILLSILLAKNYGIIGVALGTAIPMIIVKLFIQPVYVSHFIQLSLRKYFQMITLPFVISLTIVFILNVLCPCNLNLIRVNSYLILAGWTVTIGVIYFTLVFVFSTNIRKIVFSFVPIYKK